MITVSRQPPFNCQARRQVTHSRRQLLRPRLRVIQIERRNPFQPYQRLHKKVKAVSDLRLSGIACFSRLFCLKRESNVRTDFGYSHRLRRNSNVCDADRQDRYSHPPVPKDRHEHPPRRAPVCSSVDHRTRRRSRPPPRAGRSWVWACRDLPRLRRLPNRPIRYRQRRGG
jgi:hypothetical protein